MDLAEMLAAALSALQTYGAAGLVGGLIAAIVNREWTKRDRRKRIRGCLGALHAELDICCSLATTYCDSRAPTAPLYRLPLTAYESAFPILIGEGALERDAIRHIARCYGAIEEANRGLDAIAELRTTDPPDSEDDAAVAHRAQIVAQEIDRLRSTKMPKLTRGAQKRTLLDEALSVIEQEEVNYLPGLFFD